MSRAEYLLYVVAGLLLACPGWFGPRAALWMPAMLVGVIIVTVPMIRGGVARPATALALLVTLNLSYGLSYYLWHFRQRQAGAAGGPETVLGPVAVWVALFVLTGLYEFFIFLGAWRTDEQRTICGLGFVGLVIQIAVVVATVWQLVATG
jgi:hypothetical protein